MGLSASEIGEKTFETARRGYDIDQVASFLQRVSDDYQALQDRLGAAVARVARLERLIGDAKQAEESVEKSFIAAAEAKEDLVARAEERATELVEKAEEAAEGLRREAAAVLAEANEKASRTVSEARREALEVLTTSRREAVEFTEAAQTRHEDLVKRLEAARQAVAEVESALHGQEPDSSDDGEQTEILVEDDAGMKNVSEETGVNRADDLLARLRDRSSD